MIRVKTKNELIHVHVHEAWRWQPQASKTIAKLNDNKNDNEIWKKRERLGGYPPDRLKMVWAYQLSKTYIFDT